MTTYDVVVTRDRRWRTLSFPDLGPDAVTQADSDDKIETEARDYLAVSLFVDTSEISLNIIDARTGWEPTADIYGVIDDLRYTHKPDANDPDYCATSHDQGCGMTWPCSTEQLCREVERLGGLAAESVREVPLVEEMATQPTDVPQGVEAAKPTAAVFGFPTETKMIDIRELKVTPIREQAPRGGLSLRSAAPLGLPGLGLGAAAAAGAYDPEDSE